MSEERETVMLAAFSGWNDACQAATNAIHQLIDAYDAREVRHISCEGYYDYQVSRPTLCRVNGHARIVWPQTTFYDIPLSPTRHCFVMLAPEPNYRWREYCRESLHIAEELGVNRIITLGSMFADCVHTRPLPIGVCDDMDCNSECDCGEYNGPVGITTILEAMARDRSFAGTSIWVSVPQYMGNDDCPMGTLALLNTLERKLGTTFETAGLAKETQEWQAKASMLVRCSNQLEDYVHRLEEDWDKAKQAKDEASAEDPRKADQLVHEAEEFLKKF